MPSISIFRTKHVLHTTKTPELKKNGSQTHAATAFMSSAKVLTSKYEIVASKELKQVIWHDASRSQWQEYA